MGTLRHIWSTGDRPDSVADSTTRSDPSAAASTDPDTPATAADLLTAAPPGCSHTAAATAAVCSEPAPAITVDPAVRTIALGVAGLRTDPSALSRPVIKSRDVERTQRGPGRCGSAGPYAWRPQSKESTMMEALFGSPSSIWTTPVSPGFVGPAAFQHPAGFGTGTIGVAGLGPQPMLTNPGAIGTGTRDPA